MEEENQSERDKRKSRDGIYKNKFIVDMKRKKGRKKSGGEHGGGDGGGRRNRREIKSEKKIE